MFSDEENTHLKSFVEPQDRAGRHVADPVQVPRDQVGLVEPAAKHVVRLVPHTGQQSVVVCRVTGATWKKTNFRCLLFFFYLRHPPAPTQADDGDLAGRGVMRTQVDARHQQQGIVGVELGELCVAPVKLPHAGAVHQRYVAIRALSIPKLSVRKRGRETWVNSWRGCWSSDVQTVEEKKSL